MKENVANHFYYKSDILYRFLKEYQFNSNRTDLIKQYHYITNTFPVDSLINNIVDHHQNAQINRRDNYIEISMNGHFISLHIFEKHIKFRCEVLHEAEVLLFPILRLFHPYLFIISNDLEDYGWISPVKNEREQKLEQVLYSCL